MTTIQEVSYVCVRFCSTRAQQQRFRIGPKVTKGQPQATGRTHRPDTVTLSRGKATAIKNKRTFFCIFFLGKLPQLLSQPAELRAACTGLSPQQQLHQHTPHPPDWFCHTTVCQNPPQTGPKQAGPTHRHTYPNTSPSTINHYSGGLGGLLLEITLATMTQRAMTTPPAPFFP